MNLVMTKTVDRIADQKVFRDYYIKEGECSSTLASEIAEEAVNEWFDRCLITEDELELAYHQAFTYVHNQPASYWLPE
jgi:hypothetical protein